MQKTSKTTLPLPPLAKIKQPRKITFKHCINASWTPRGALVMQSEVLWQLICHPLPAAEETKVLQKSFHHPNSVKELICSLKGRAIDVNKFDGSGHTLLHALLKFPADFGGKLLQSTQQRRSELILALLVNSNADVNARTQCVQRVSPLHLAIQLGDETCVKLLIAFDADINAHDARGRTPLDVARSSGLVSIENVMMKFGGMHGFVQTQGFQRTHGSQDGADQHTERCVERCSKHTPRSIDIDAISSAYAYPGLPDIRIKNGYRVLCLDGGGIKGLVQIEVLCELERTSGRKITELFDWFVGTSTGALILLAVIYGKKSLQDLRQMYFGLKDKVITRNGSGFGFNSEALEDIIVDYFGKDVRMSDIQHPKVLITAVSKMTSKLELHIFNNCFDNQFSNELVWKVARYTSAAPMYFTEFENYVDGGVLANNPCEVGLTAIQNYSRMRGVPRPITLLVSVGSGLCPGRQLGSTNVQEYFMLGRHWLNPDGFKERIKNLILLVGNALADSELVTQNCQCRCEEQGIQFYRFNPCLDSHISLGETDMQKLIDMVIETKIQTPKQGLYELMHQLLS